MVLNFSFNMGDAAKCLYFGIANQRGDLCVKIIRCP